MPMAMVSTGIAVPCMPIAWPAMMYWCETKLASRLDVNIRSPITYCAAMSKYGTVSDCGT